MIKVMSIFGTRPEAIKMAPVIQEMERHKNEIQSIICVTAQHREMLDSVLKTFRITPDYDLNIMKKDQTLESVTVTILKGLDNILEEEKPDMVLVHGDTTTTFASALSAFYHKIPVGHVEAGLRTYDISSPYPEEANRQMVSSIAELHFTPTMQSQKNLLRENKDPGKIYVTGNTAIDALKTTVRKEYHSPVLEWAKDARILLLTAHRRENQGMPLRRIFTAVNRITEKYEDIRVIYPCHMNPAVRELAGEMFQDNDRVRVIEPLEVTDFHNLIKRSYLILTDSGGIQEEGPSLGKPVLVVRETTERPEGVEAGTLKLVGTSTDNIVKQVSRLLEDETEYERMSNAENPYGDGHASERIVEAVIKYFNGRITGEVIPA
ncbi:MAG TPA: UDP-N-acetylglucosamine 2-epimerase (non-hydrolyzing) [Candidatus Mediterraneibacter pullistercoris]|nr:UDP-N-acetylglucosamine 2-epimerase (non-hydrolyzing) [Candidatus Mediterraneibacter pullistercoris]